MINFLLVIMAVVLTAFMAFIAGFMFCQWGHNQGLQNRRDDRNWQANEWN